MINYQSPLDDKIVVFGMSCVGKTTFAKLLTEYHYYCFDAMFYWHQIEVLGGSIKQNLIDIQKQCCADKFVLDGWSLGDTNGEFLPQGSVVYVIYTTYENIINQYRIEVSDPEEHRTMFKKWYGINYKKPCRFFRNDKAFNETSVEEFNSLMCSQ